MRSPQRLLCDLARWASRSRHRCDLVTLKSAWVVVVAVYARTPVRDEGLGPVRTMRR